MGEVTSMTGLGATAAARWSWCIPAGLSKELKVVVVLVMTDWGMRFIPTRIPAPTTYRHLQTNYVELAASAAEIELAESSWAWRLSRVRSWPTLAQEKVIFDSLNDMLAAARFLPVSEIQCEPADRPIPESDTYLGRSVLVRPRGSRAPVTAWVTSREDLFELVCLNLAGRPRRFAADWTCLMEDGTPPRSRAGRRIG